MKRTGEKTLIIIATLFNLVAIFLTAIIFFGLKSIIQDPNLAKSILEDPTLQSDETLTMSEFQTFLDVITPYVNVLGWMTLIALIISLILGLVAWIRLKNESSKNMKIVGVLLIIAGVLSGVISITSILYYVAAIMCFVRKKVVLDDVEYNIE